jgi:hypothetical protein
VINTAGKGMTMPQNWIFNSTFVKSLVLVEIQMNLKQILLLILAKNDLDIDRRCPKKHSTARFSQKAFNATKFQTLIIDRKPISYF